jgi:hypothetical protein
MKMKKKRPHHDKPKLRGHVFAVRLLTDTFVCAWVRAASPRGLLQVFVCKTIFNEMPDLKQVAKNFKKANCMSMFLRTAEKDWDRWTDLGTFKPNKPWKIPTTVGFQFADKQPRVLKFSESLAIIGKKLASKKQAKEFPEFVVMDLDQVAKFATLHFDDEFPEELGMRYAF